jgi:hypothetical protein
MRAVFLVLSVLLVTGCAQRHADPSAAGGRVMPADFAGTVDYANGTVAPPYHYEWRVTFDDATAVVEWRPGYAESVEPWRAAAAISEDQRVRLYGRLRALGVFETATAADDGLVGGPSGAVRVVAAGHTHTTGPLGGSESTARLLGGVADAVRELVPADVWAGLRARQDEWGDRQPK